MINPHIVVGEGRRCICGNYDGVDITCADVLVAMECVGPLEPATVVKTVINSLLVECAEPYVENSDGTHHHQTA